MVSSSALALCACSLDTAVPEPENDGVRGLDAALPTSLPDASPPIVQRPLDGGKDDDDEHDAGKHDAGKPRDAGKPHDADVASDAALDAGTGKPPDAGRCGGPCPSDRPVCREDGTCVQCERRADCTEPGASRCEQTTHVCVACLEDADCDGTTPACDITTHSCVGCVNNEDCTGDTPICDTPNQVCLGCLSDLDCKGELKHCQADGHRCVECALDSHCIDPARSHCAASACVPCSDSTQCTHLATTPICAVGDDDDDSDENDDDDSASGASGTCVECQSHTDCTDLARPQCDDNHCEQCTDDDACEGRLNATVCDDGDGRRGRRRGQRGSGACVQCTAEHDNACGEGVCDEELKICTDRSRESARLCAPCLGDSECDEDRICASAEPTDPAAAAYCVIASNEDACVESCALDLPLACAFAL
jgi:hypothetical protein